MSTIKITGKPPVCNIQIDGKPVHLVALDLHLDAESLPEVTVTPPIFDVDVDTEGTVKLTQLASDTMLALGWTPPADGDGHKPEMSDAEFDRRLRLWMRVNPAEFDAYMRQRARRQGTRP